MTDWAVIFDVDGVLLELTAYEEDAFFTAFKERYGLTGLSRDWDSYRIRNDEDIVREVLSGHFGRDAAPSEIADFKAAYLGQVGALAEPPVEIPGASELLAALDGKALGVATANFIDAARLRLERKGLWKHVRRIAFGADGGGHKREILARAIAALDGGTKVVYVGDNLNDLDAGLANGTHFIAFSRSETRRSLLKANGARMISGDHAETLRLINRITSSA